MFKVNGHVFDRLGGPNRSDGFSIVEVSNRTGQFVVFKSIGDLDQGPLVGLMYLDLVSVLLSRFVLTMKPNSSADASFAGYSSNNGKMNSTTRR